MVELFRAVRRGIAEGMTNLTQYSNSTNQSLASLKDGLNTVNNALAAAFAPVLDVVAPILNTLIDMLVTAINAVNAFFAALTGSGTYTMAVRGLSGFAGAAGGAGDAAGGAAKEAEKLKRTIMGFDQINKLDEQNSSSGGGGGGGGGGCPQIPRPLRREELLHRAAGPGRGHRQRHDSARPEHRVEEDSASRTKQGALRAAEARLA